MGGLCVGWITTRSPNDCGLLAAEDRQLASQGSLTAKRPCAMTDATAETCGTKDKLPEVPKQPDSTRSAPPDTTPYVRPTVPEDYNPKKQEKIP